MLKKFSLTQMIGIFIKVALFTYPWLYSYYIHKESTASEVRERLKTVLQPTFLWLTACYIRALMINGQVTNGVLRLYWVLYTLDNPLSVKQRMYLWRS